MSSSLLNGISISISDEDSEDRAGKLRVRLRRNRKKRGDGSFLRRIFRVSRRWWPVLLFLPAIALLLFETSKLAMKPRGEGPAALSDPKPIKVESVDPKHDEERVNLKPVKDSPPGNLNRLDPVMRVIGGVKQSCLKLLSPGEIQKLEFPDSAEPNSPIKKVAYRSDSGNHPLRDNIALSTQNSDAARFNLFTGFQTLKERGESFKANGTAVVHCGFYSENGGFKISDDDQRYMQTCKAVVSTCAFGGGDDLYQPIGMTEASLEKVCYVAFWDEITRSAQEAVGIRINEEHMVGKWHVVVVKDLPFSDQRLNGKIPKMLSHRLFPQARYSIWVDSKSQFRRDPLGVLEALLWRTNSTLAISEHGARSSLYDEAKAVVRKNKATPEEVEVQLNQYRRDGIPDDKRFDGKKALSEASIIVREHTPSTNLFTCLWFNEVVRFTSRDQLSFPYVLRRLKMPGINMFPVCKRKDLVNSMGHKRKVKPLVKLNGSQEH